MIIDDLIKRLTSESLAFATSDRAVKLYGTDVRSWLQGQITNDIHKLSPESPLSACICSPTGQLMTTVRLHDQDDRIIAITPHPEVLFSRVEDFVIMEDVSAELLPGAVSTIQGLGARGVLAHDRTGFGGFDDLESLTDVLSESELLDLEILAGIPRFGFEIGPKTLPPELGPNFDREFINYEKGCYTGQEVLQRIHSRGHTNKTLVGLLSDRELKAGEVVLGGQKVGTIHRVAHSTQFGFLATATLRNEFTDSGTLLNCNSGTATVQSLPFSL
jgi:tRNA-modifying protein YgfZ